MKALWIFGGVFFAIGMAMLFGGVSWWRTNAAFAAIASSTEGTVTDLAYRSSSKGGGTYAPIVEFAAPNGDRIHITGSGSKPPAYARGDKVRVLYDAAKPQNARIDSFMESTFGPLLLTGLGTVFALTGAGVLYARVRQRKLVRRSMRQDG